MFGQWWWAAWIMLLCNCVLPLSLFSQKLRRNTIWLWILSIFINLGMWFERFVIFIPSLSHEFEPWQWALLHARRGSTLRFCAGASAGSSCGSCCSSGRCRSWRSPSSRRSHRDRGTDRRARGAGHSPRARTAAEAAGSREEGTDAGRDRCISAIRMRRSPRSRKRSAARGATSRCTCRRPITRSSDGHRRGPERRAAVRADRRAVRHDIRLLDPDLDLAVLAAGGRWQSALRRGSRTPSSASS